jgi:hypothetical protein
MRARPPLQQLLTTPELSSYRESLLEQLFCAELLQASWTAGHPPIELSHAFVDFQGYDLIATCGPITRHIQLKAVAGKAVHWDLHRALASKPSACCVLMYPSATEGASHISLAYRYFGATPDAPLVFDESLKPPPHPRPKAEGQPEIEGPRRARLNHLRVPRARFSSLTDIDGLVALLFGQDASSSA